MAEEKAGGAARGKPKCMIIDRKFKPDDLKIKRNQEYVRDLGQCFKIFQKWGYDIIMGGERDRCDEGDQVVS